MWPSIQGIHIYVAFYTMWPSIQGIDLYVASIQGIDLYVASIQGIDIYVTYTRYRLICGIYKV